MELPSSLDDVEAFIRNEVQESVSLDYKRSDAIDRTKRREIAKDVAAFANSAGGMLIYGVVEQDHLPVSIDDGVDHTVYSREWLEQVVLSGISPRPGDLRISQVPIDDTHSVFAVMVAQAVRGPHILNNDGRYYKRFNFSSVPMEHFEIEDVRSRSLRVPPLVSVDVAIEASFIACIEVKNTGPVAAHDLRFEFDPPVPWEAVNIHPRLLLDGATRFPPGRVMRFVYGTFPEIAGGKKGLPPSLNITVTYTHPGIGAEVREPFLLDFLDYLGSSGITPDSVRAAEKVEKVLQDLHRDVHAVAEQLGDLSRVADATGLALSVPTLRRLQAAARGDADLEKLCADYAARDVFREVLRTDSRVAHRLHQFFSASEVESKLEDVEGVTPDLAAEVRRHFYSVRRAI